MSKLNIALSYKRQRAQTVVDFIYSILKKLEKGTTKEEIILKKKSNRMIYALKDRTEKESDDFQFLLTFFEYTGKVIDKFEKFEGDTTEIYQKLEWVNEIKPIVIFDIDDTLRDASHRMDIRHKIESLKTERSIAKDVTEKEYLSRTIDEMWQEFFIAGFNDTPKQDVIDICNMYYDLGFEVRIRTGASATYYDRTVQYLEDIGVKYHHLRMRKEGVRIPDFRLKPAWISKYDIGGSVLVSYDDRIPLNEGYQKKGVKTTILVDKEFNAEEHLKEFNEQIQEQLQFFK